MDSTIWVVIISAALSVFFSLVSYSLRGLRRSDFSERKPAPAGGTRSADGEEPPAVASLERHLTPLRLAVSFCRATCNLVLVVALAAAFNVASGEGAAAAPHAWRWDRAIAAIATAAGIIAIFCVAIPHAWATHSGSRIVAALYVPLMAIRYALFPIVLVMQAFEVPVRRLAGAGEESTEGELAKQEILQAATEGAAEGAVEHEEAQMIASVIEFANRQAGSIMTPRTDLFALPVETPWLEACRELVAHGHTRVPVYEGDLDNIIGVLYAKDLLKHVGAEQPVDLRAIVRKPFFVPETKPLNDLLQEFKRRRVHFSVVLDEYGGTAGIVTIEDILEEIVGEIADEYDRAEPALMHRLDATSAEVDGRMYTADLNEAMGLEIPESPDYMTVAGMVFSELGYIPKAGEKLESHGARFTVLAADERKITKIKVELRPQKSDDERAE